MTASSLTSSVRAMIMRTVRRIRAAFGQQCGDPLRAADIHRLRPPGIRLRGLADGLRRPIADAQRMTANSLAKQAQIGSHAIVLGASMAGLLAARVLADLYPRVTVVERDTLCDTATVRRGVPQGRHAHGLLMRGAQALEELFRFPTFSTNWSMAARPCSMARICRSCTSA